MASGLLKALRAHQELADSGKELSTLLPRPLIVRRLV